MKRPVNSRAVALLLFALPLLSLQGMDWPLYGGKIEATFGSNSGEEFVNGISLISEGNGVEAVEDGEVVFYFDRERVAGKVPSGLGNFVVVQHDGGLLSGYTHLQSGSFPEYAEAGYRLNQGQRIGRIGDSGWTYGKGLGFFIFDTEFSQFVNPYLVLPRKGDSRPPVVENPRFVFGDSVLVLEENMVLGPGEYELHADIYDLNAGSQGFTAMAPYSIAVFVNGAENYRTLFEGLTVEEGRTVLQKGGGKAFSEIYAGERTVKLGKFDLSPGKMSIEIIAADYAGNETAITRAFSVADLQE